MESPVALYQDAFYIKIPESRVQESDLVVFNVCIVEHNHDCVLFQRKMSIEQTVHMSSSRVKITLTWRCCTTSSWPTVCTTLTLATYRAWVTCWRPSSLLLKMRSMRFGVSPDSWTEWCVFTHDLIWFGHVILLSWLVFLTCYVI